MGKKDRRGATAAATPNPPGSAQPGSSQQLTWGAFQQSLFFDLPLAYEDTAGILAGDHQQRFEGLPRQLFKLAAARPPTAADKLDVDMCDTLLLTLLIKVLRTRQRPRELGKEPYQASLTAVLAASALMRNLRHGMAQDGKLTDSAEILSPVAAAMDAVAVCLLTPSQQPAAPCQPAPAQRPQQQQQQQFQRLASALLGWCLSRGGSVLACPDKVAGTTMQLRAITLAAALARSLPAQPDNVEYVDRVLEVLDRVFYHLHSLARVNSTRGKAVLCELCISPAVLQLSTALLVLLYISKDGTHRLEQHEQHGGGSSSRGPPVSSSTAPGATTVCQPSQQQEQAWQAAARTTARQVWAAAGFAEDALGMWLDHATRLAERDALLRYTLRAAALQELAAGGQHASSSSSNSSSSSSSSSNKRSEVFSSFKFLPAASSHTQGAFVIVAQVLTKCMLASCGVLVADGSRLSRQQQQLLQAVMQQLPLLLLQSALLFGGRQPLVAEVAAQATWVCCTSWQIPGLYPPTAAAANAAAAASGGVGSGESAPAAASLTEAVLPAMLDAWLRLMQQQLESSRFLHVSPLVHSRQTCSCYTTDRSSNCDRQGGACAWLYCLSVVLSALQPLTDFAGSVASLSVWRSKMPAVLLVLEVVVRRLQLPLPCSSSSGSSSAAAVAAGRAPPVLRSSASARLHHQLAPVLLQLACSGGRPLAAPLRLLVEGVPGSASGAADAQQQQQQQQLQQLAQQVFSVAASHVKAYRHPWGLAADDLSARRPWRYMFSAVGSMLQQQLQSCSPGSRQLPAVRALLAPWVVLSGAYMRQAAIALLNLKGAAGRTCYTALLQMHPEQQRQLNDAAHAEGVASLRTALLSAADMLDSLMDVRRVACSLLESYGADTDRGGDGGSSGGSGGSGCGFSSGSSSNSGSKGGVGRQATPADVQARGDQDQQQQQQQPTTASLSLDEGNSWPAYVDLDCELENIRSGPLSKVVAESQRILSAAVQHDTSLGGKGLDYGLPEVQVLLGDQWVFRGLSIQMQDFGAALCAKLPVPWWCNNPGCTALGGASELQLVGGKGCVCGGCRVARYCSRSCQAADWAKHKAVCAQLSGAAAAAPAGGQQ